MGAHGLGAMKPPFQTGTTVPFSPASAACCCRSLMNECCSALALWPKLESTGTTIMSWPCSRRWADFVGRARDISLATDDPEPG